MTVAWHVTIIRWMAFDPKEAEKLLARCRRRCCVCQRFCGSKMELDHMVPKADGGPDDIENAIPLCFECHAEVHAYNDKHPRGRKFQPSELKLHKQQWLAFCDSSPGALAQMSTDASVGPLQALLDELDFNLEVAARVSAEALGCPFMNEQFRRAIQTGALALLADEMKAALHKAYADIGRANQFLLNTQHHPIGSNAYNTALNEAQQVVMKAPAAMREAREKMLKFLASE